MKKNDEWRIRIGVLVERQRAYGRRLCEGVAAYAGEHPGISLGMLEWRDLNDVRKRHNGSRCLCARRPLAHHGRTDVPSEAVKIR